jgi:hypothetical protein
MLRLGKYSIGIGDRFGRQGRAQLRALMRARERGVSVVPVWNKSYREHMMVRTAPADVRREADLATDALGWGAAYHVDADHIGLHNVGPFLDTHDFFTLDVADFIGKGEDEGAVRGFVSRHARLSAPIELSGVDAPLRISTARLAASARVYLPAVREAGRIYRRVADAKGEGKFITELSMDEVDTPQTPEDLLVILAAVAEEGIPLQTIAPRFSGLFAKGVDYRGDVAWFTRELSRTLGVIGFAARELGLPSELKLSVHSGSDKLSLYGPIRRALRRHDAGLHLKTAGTTWLEELIGLAEGGEDGLAIAKEIYTQALARADELCRPYTAVLDLDPAKLPPAETVARWDGEAFAGALRHDPACPRYDPHLRQLLHVAYKVAAEMGPRYLDALDRHEEVIGRNVTENLFDRHVARVFLDEAA